jgi:acyl-CoA synthetase (AMP-forming)/AMP-acid ligase II
MRLLDLLARSVQLFPEKKVAVFPNEQLTYAELDRAAKDVSTHLLAEGIGPGRRLALIGENSAEQVINFWGAQRAGATVVDIPATSGVSAIHTMLSECRPAKVFLSPKQEQRLGKIELQEPATDDVEVASIVYTSGTTGRPKGVKLTHRNLISNIEAFNACIGLDSTDSLLVVVPLHYIHGRIQLLTHIMLGATLYFSAGFQFPSVVLDELQKYSVTGFSGVPYHFATLLGQTKLSTTELPHLKNLTITGGALSSAQLRQLAAAVPGAKIHLNYGQTEASPRLTYLGPGEIFEKIGSCGRALPGVTLELAGDEVIASGPGIMKGYVSGDEISSGVIDALGRLHTGDQGRLDSEGYLFLSGRSSEMIKCAGERIFPREIEEILDLHPQVAESAVLGVADPMLGEKLIALIAPKSAVPAIAELKQHCLKSLPFVRVPRDIRFVAKLPKTPSGKLSRAELKNLV